MATPKGSAIAAPQIFGSDPVEQIHAKGLTDLDTGGLSYAFLNAARGDRSRVQDRYMDSLRESNMMASQLARYEADQELLGTLLKTAAEHANAGIDPSTIPVTGRMYANPADPLTRQPAYLSRDLKASQAAKNRADAANAGSGSADQFTVQQNVGPGGVPGDTVITGKGRNPTNVQGTVRSLAGQTGTGGGGGGAGPNVGTVTMPDGTVRQVPIADARTIAQGQVVAGRPSASNAQARGQQTRADAEAKARAEANRTQKKLENQ